MDEHAVFLRPPVWLPIVVALIAGGSYIYGKNIETRSLDLVTISVSGEGKVYANPDIAQLSFGVQTGRMATAQEAMESLTKQMDAVINAVKGEGVPEKDITTQGLSLYPAYDWNEGQRVEQGFEASQSLSVKVRDMDQIGAVLSRAAAAGANQVGGVSFTIDDPSNLQEAAREEAIADAKEKAQELAAQLGKQLGEITGFSEGGGYYPPMPYMKMDAAESAMGGVSRDMEIAVPTGEQEVSVTVTLSYEVF